MVDKPVVFFDINIILDVLQRRIPFYETSAKLLAFAETGRIQGYCAAHSITTLFYLVRKDKSTADARTTITDLLHILQVAPVDHATIERALNLDYRDFEDAVQMISAENCGADFLATRNVKDYKYALLPVIKPVDLLNTL